MGNLVRICKNILTGEIRGCIENEEYEPTGLVFDSETKIVYYKFTQIEPIYPKNFKEQKPMDTKVGYMCPYISNGKYCCFMDNKIVEIG